MKYSASIACDISTDRTLPGLSAICQCKADIMRADEFIQSADGSCLYHLIYKWGE